MKLKLYKQIFENGLASMICEVIDDRVVLIGGTNFEKSLPPDGTKTIHNEKYLFDTKFNLISRAEGIIKAENGITIKANNCIYYILSNKIYKIYILNDELIEEELLLIDDDIPSGFGAFLGDRIIFGYKKVYELKLDDLTLTRKKDFIAEVRSQSVFAYYNRHIYVLSGASNIAHLDAYKYSVDNDDWVKLKNTPVSFVGSSSLLLEDKLLIMGGFNKEIYDEAVKNLSDLGYKRKYFEKDRFEFNWNSNIYLYDFSKDAYEVIGEDKMSATCGSKLLQIDDRIYLVNGEIKPGFRNPYVLVGKVNYEKDRNFRKN